MQHELAAIERQGMLEKIESLKASLAAMQDDFTKCAKGISPCFFCANDSTCQCTEDTKCNFIWESHN